MCQKHGINLTNANKQLPKRENYSIIVTFNHEPIVENIIILFHLYRNRFRNLIFCGSKLIEKLNFAQQEAKKFDHFTFIEIFNSFRGRYHYFCMNKAIEMGYKTQGFLLLSDDVFLKHWNLRKLNQKNVWFPSDLILNIDPNKPLKDWGHSIKGFPNLLKTWKNMEEIASNKKSSSEIEKNIIENYFKIIDQNQDLGSTNKSRKIKKCGSDLFYVPKGKFSDFVFLSGMFRKYDTFLEIAVPNVLAGIERNSSVQIIKGRYVWNGAPLNFNDYDRYEVFYHPFKLSKLNRGLVGRDYCKLYLKDVFMIN
ncbi:hypothetical protein BpHYR1_019050 [Brachionus plicatilis]|uniref:Uncharacterized protein n=1 Tax=Brachionus plicatilis TaxID=10195 RepID=A0A3M7P4W1_BRAPC|nr:hypothetical protein BpHYR1_019050 [Brachionus plicatilis]